jgi:hypothetical protein
VCDASRTAGQTVEYTRTPFVPTLIAAGEATIRVGLYNDSGRLPLDGPHDDDRSSTDRSYRVAALSIGPDPDNVFLIHARGWHPDEFSPDDPGVSWRWTTATAVLSVRNPRSDAVLWLEYAARPDLFPDGAQRVTITAGEHTLDRFAADSGDKRLRRIPIRADQFGVGELTELRIDVDRTVVPASRPGAGEDTRALGIQVYHAFVQGR